jgi:hypothetical protein
VRTDQSEDLDTVSIFTCPAHPYCYDNTTNTMRNATLAAALASLMAAATALTTSADYTDLHPIVAPTAFSDVTETTHPWRCGTEDPMT